MSNPMAMLVTDLIRNISAVSKADGAEFSASIKDSFESCSTFESYLTGIAERQYVHCISQCLQQSAENATSPEIRPYLWNPIVASFIKCINALAEREPYGAFSKSPGKSSCSSRKIADKKTLPRQTLKKVDGNTKSKPKDRPVAEISAAAAKISLEQTKGVETPSTNSGTEVDAQVRLKAYAESRSARQSVQNPFFKQLKGGNHGEPVTCKVPGCTVCEKYFSYLPLTRCQDIRCHRAGTCTSSGWYPHVLPHIWGAIKKAHDDPRLEVVFSGLPTAQLPPLEQNPLIEKPLPRKRCWAQAAVSDTIESSGDEVTSPKIMSPVWSPGAWNDMYNEDHPVIGQRVTRSPRSQND